MKNAFPGRQGNKDDDNGQISRPGTARGIQETTTYTPPEMRLRKESGRGRARLPGTKG